MVSKKVFIASDAFFAFIDRAHQKHLHAGAFFRYFAQERYQLFTDMITVNDTYNQLYEKISPSVGRDFLRALSLGNINILYPEDPDIKSTWKLLLNYQSSDLKLAEALMAVLANKRNIPLICTFTYLHSLFGLQLFYLPI